MLFVTGLVEYPSYITLCLFMDKAGRRSMISSFMIVGGLLCIVAGFIPQGKELTIRNLRKYKTITAHNIRYKSAANKFS